MSRRLADKQRPRTKGEQRANTRQQLLDAAEYLFSKHGLNGVTVRDVAAKAGVDSSLVNYHFGDKSQLFQAVFARRAGTTRSRRLEALERYERECAGAPTVEGVLHAFLDPELELYMTGGEGWKNFAAFVAQAVRFPQGADMVDVYFDPVVFKLIKLLRKALPGCSDEEIFRCYDFMTGAYVHTLERSGRIDRLSGGVCKSGDYGAVKARLASFMAAGFSALCARSRAAARAEREERGDESR